MKKFEQHKAKNPQNLILSEHNSMFKTTVYIAVDKEIPNTEIITLSGTFLTKTFEGPYKNAGTWAKEMDTYVASEGKSIKNYIIGIQPAQNVQKSMEKTIQCCLLKYNQYLYHFQRTDNIPYLCSGVWLYICIFNNLIQFTQCLVFSH